LRYFGEELTTSCGHCDNCLRKKELFDATKITQKILSGVIRTGSRFGSAHIIQVLRGGESAQILRQRHNQLSVYGIVQDFSKEELKYLIQALIEKGLLMVSTGEYPTLSVTPAGYAFLQKKEKLELPKPGKTETLEAKSTWQTIEYHPEIFEELRQLRKQLADAQGVPPFVIFSDLSLQEMAYYLPQNTESFRQISGVGQIKQEQLGATFVTHIQELTEKYQAVPRKIESRRKSATKASVRGARRTGSNYQKTKTMLQQKMSLAAMAKAHGFTEGTIMNHIEALLQAGEAAEIAYLAPAPEILTAITAAFIHCGSEQMKPVFEHLQEQYSYDQIRLVRLFLQK
jgi:ATP-dependent DNA helicase RecQ